MDLKEALCTYVGKVGERLRPHQTQQVSAADVNRLDLNVLEPKDHHDLRVLVEGLEKEIEFKNLVRETARAFSPKPNDRPFLDLWAGNVEAFLRRSGFYLEACQRTTPDAAALLTSYTKAFLEKTTTVRYVVPLEFVDFDENVIEFGSFRVVRLNRDELQSLIGSETNKIFYPYACADITSLPQIWLLEVTESVRAWEPGSGGPAGLRGAELDFKSTDFPPPVEDALKLLALHDWGTYQAPFGGTEPSNLVKQLDTGWDRFHIPFVIILHDNELWSPNVLPNLDLLSTQPDMDENGEEIGERPVVSIWVEGSQFSSNMERIVKFTQCSKLERSKGWQFLDTALSYLCKAFFAEGLDQLLWHLVAVEALLGDKSESGLTSRLAKRVAFVAASDEQAKERIRKLITSEHGLYQLRSDLVHGNAELISKRVYLGHLREARELARVTVLWFLELLAHSIEKAGTKSAEDIPTREEILAAIDVLSNSGLNAKRVQDLMTFLAPAG